LNLNAEVGQYDFLGIHVEYDPRKFRATQQYDSPSEENSTLKYSFGVHSAIFNTLRTTGDVHIHCDGDAQVDIIRKTSMIIGVNDEMDGIWTPAIDDFVVVMLPRISAMLSMVAWLKIDGLTPTPANFVRERKVLDPESHTMMYIFKVVPKVKTDFGLLKRNSMLFNLSTKSQYNYLPDKLDNDWNAGDIENNSDANDLMD